MTNPKTFPQVQETRTVATLQTNALHLNTVASHISQNAKIFEKNLCTVGEIVLGEGGWLCRD